MNYKYQQTGVTILYRIDGHTSVMVKSSPSTVSLFLFDKDDELVNECSFDPNSEFVHDQLEKHLEPIQFIGNFKKYTIHSLTKLSEFIMKPHDEGGIYIVNDIMDELRLTSIWTNYA